MPNLQHWLNAWVKVNTKQGNAALPAPFNSSGHSTGTKPHHAKAHPNRTSSHQSSTTVVNNAISAERSNGGLRDTLSKGLTTRDGSSPSTLIEQLHNASLSSIGDPTVTTTSTHAHPLESEYSNTEPVAVRKLNIRKHKRRLHRTNSFSDLIREKAKNRSISRGSNSRHVSVERTIYAGPAEQVTGRRFSHHYHPQYHHHIRPPRSIPPPPTLHHHYVEPEPSLDGDSSDASSAHSVSPTETAVTVPHSNMHQQHSNTGDYYSRNQPNFDASSNALVGVAEFFGTEVDELDIRRLPTAPSGARHETHAAQHGTEDDLPHYLQSYLQDNSHQSQEQALQRNAPSSIHHHADDYTTNSSSTSSSRLKHSPHHQSHTSSRHTIHHQNDRAYPPLPPYRRSNSAKDTPGPSSARKAAPPPPKPAPQPADPGLVLGGVRLPFFSRPSTPTTSDNDVDSSNKDSNNNKYNSKSNPFGIGEPNCQGCQVAQAELKGIQESLEYMRTMAIRKEYTCDKCGKSNDNSDNKYNNNNKTPSVKKASQRMSEVTARHKKQVEHLMKERNHWQRNIHMKLDKVSNLSRNLNNESLVRVAESKELKEELVQTKEERDRMAGELEQLKTKVQEYEKEREEHRLVQEKITTYENEGLRQAEQAIAARDDMIAKLIARLGTTLDSLALEREQLRQRRQIIFPPTSTKSSQPRNQPDNSGESEELKRLREQLLESQRHLQSAQLEAKQKETALLFRCETLEKQLEKATNRGPDRNVAPKETHHLSGKNGWDL